MCKNEGAEFSGDDFDAADVAAMRLALKQAKLAAAAGEVPVGAVVYASSGEVVGLGRNRTLAECDITAHAEIMALRAASIQVNNHRLPHLRLAATLEPCAMCAGAIFQARVSRLIFAAGDEKTGVCGGAASMHLQKKINPHTRVFGGLFADESARLLGEFFAARRPSKN